MHRALINASLVLLAIGLHAAEPDYPRDVTKWEEVAIPPKSDQRARMEWFYAASYSRHEWRVFTEGGQPRAQLTKEAPDQRTEKPKFTPKAGQFHGASAFAAVDDGWLVGFSKGEFGAALYSFSHDGTRSYRISGHQVVDFFSLPDGIHAIEGLAHMGMSRGSVIRIARPEAGALWQADCVAPLPFAPCAVALRRDGTMLITLSESLVSVGSDHKIDTLLPDAPWAGLYPNSSVLTPDEQKLYIGMRQFLGEFDLTTKKLRLLIPAKQFLNMLPKEDEDRIRKQYGD